MESREDLKSILPYLPLLVRSSSLSWPSVAVEEALKAMAKGPDHSMVDTGEALFVAITALRRLSPCLSSETLDPSASHGYAFFFDELMSEAESAKWFGKFAPALSLFVGSALSACRLRPFQWTAQNWASFIGFPRARGGGSLPGIYMYPMFIFFSI